MFNGLIITSNTTNTLAFLPKFYLLPDKKVDWLWPQREMAQLCPILWCVLQLFRILGYSLWEWKVNEAPALMACSLRLELFVKKWDEVLHNGRFIFRLVAVLYCLKT